MLTVNGKPHTPELPENCTLLQSLREELGLNGPKLGCGEGECGACTVLVDGRPQTACNTPLWDVKGKAITTLEGLTVDGKPGKVQQAFIDAQAVQCGYCTNGMVMASAALLAKNRNPSDEQINDALAGNLCRCGTHQRICAAVKRAAQAA